MRFKSHIILFINLIYLYSLSGQDLNQTNTRYSLLYVNPAFTGHFPGSYRVGALYRDQGKWLMRQGYRTLNLYMDAPVSLSFKKYSWLGVGIQVYNDKAGLLPLTTSGLIMNMGYHMVFDKHYKNIFSIGLQLGFLHRYIESDGIDLESDHLDPGVFLKDRQELTIFNDNLKDFNIGINFKSQISKAKLFNIGFAVYHISNPEYQGIRNNNYIDRRFTFHSGLQYGINKRLTLKPQIIFSISRNAYNIMAQFKSFFKISNDKRKNDMVFAGVGYRVNDALELMFGIRYKDVDIGIAYDITVSGAVQFNQGRGGLEIGVFRIFTRRKKVKIIPVLLCPEL